MRSVVGLLALLLAAVVSPVAAILAQDAAGVKRAPPAAFGAAECSSNAECLRRGKAPLRPRKLYRQTAASRTQGRRADPPAYSLTPCILNTAYAFSGAARYCLVPSSGYYTLQATGAAGAASPVATGGQGASTSATYYLTRGQVVGIFVGGTPATGGICDGGGGGGGSFVYVDGTPLVVGGGGGGAGAAGSSGRAAVTGLTDPTYPGGQGRTYGPQGAQGGKNGSGGGSSSQASGGGGVAGTGAGASGGNTYTSQPPFGASSSGGYGGGGSRGYPLTGGGGGGYSGGGAGGGTVGNDPNSHPTCGANGAGGGGGSSYVAPAITPPQGVTAVAPGGTSINTSDASSITISVYT